MVDFGEIDIKTVGVILSLVVITIIVRDIIWYKKSGQEKINEIMGIGNLQYERLDFDMSIGTYSRVIHNFKTQPLAYYNRGMAYLAKEDFINAEKDFTKVIEIDPDYGNSYLERAKTLVEQRRFKDAISDLDQAISLYHPVLSDWDISKVLCNKAILLWDRHEVNKSLECLEEALHHDQTTFLAWYYKGLILSQEYQAHENALSCFDKAVKYGLHTRDIYIHRAETKQKLGDLQGAEQDFEKAGELEVEV